MAIPPAKPAVLAANKTKKNNLSGKTWWKTNQGKTEFANSTSISDLEANFKNNVTAFKKAIEDAGASIAVSTTKRSEKRAYVLHWAWKVSKGLVKANAVPAKVGVDIEWDHGSEAASKLGAKEIITEANVAYQPSLTSRHIQGKAIDWTITWKSDLKIKKKDGTTVAISSQPRHGGKGSAHNGNADFHAVGKTYGVTKASFTKIDGPHWSTDGK
ncbi:MAG: hypothetical protein K6L76_14480 [Agarilytica sp.]